MVQEEAWLRNMIRLPKSAQDWYKTWHVYCRATWIPLRRGNVNPLKEIKANILAMQHNLRTMAQTTAEIGGGGYEANLDQRELERQAKRDREIILPAEAGKSGAGLQALPAPQTEGEAELMAVHNQCTLLSQLWCITRDALEALAQEIKAGISDPAAYFGLDARAEKFSPDVREGIAVVSLYGGNRVAGNAAILEEGEVLVIRPGLAAAGELI